MIFHENPLLADNSHVIYLNLSKIGKDVAKFVVCCSRDWHFKPGGRGGVLLYFHIYLGLGYFLGFKILNFNILGVFPKKMNIFGGFEDFVDIFLGSSQNLASLWIISMQFRVFF